ncbi:MAG: hypothetical protein JW749_06365 [Sedimentisphaerales bacterium]|nr:hypothetical protein [Sedimentisphaerales bacterium]
MTTSTTLIKTLITRCILVVILAIAFGYIEAAVVVYLRQIFHPAGFDFPLLPFGLTETAGKMLLVEIGREAATLVLILSACLLIGQNRRERLAYFLIIFAVWDIFYYVFLKLILGWPASITDWDVLFLIPVPWAGPVLAPVIVSVIMLVFAGVTVYRDWAGRPIITDSWDWLGFSIAALVIVASFCNAGRFMQSADFATHFSWTFFGAGVLGAAVLFAKCVYKKESPGKPGG